MKPPYKVPTMAEIDATPSNGFTVASLFAGVGQRKPYGAGILAVAIPPGRMPAAHNC